MKAILGVLLLVAVVYAIVKTIQTSASTGSKVLWVAVLVLVPVIGLILWVFLGPA